MLMKKIKKCKNCQKVIVNPKNSSKSVGVTKFCSMLCFYSFYNRNKYKLSNHKTTQKGKLITTESLNTPLFHDIQPSTEFSSETALEKEVYDKDEAYLKFIRKSKCAVPGCTNVSVIAHHIYAAGLGLKASDYDTVPLCIYHHTGNEGVHKLGLINFQNRFYIDLIKISIRYLKEYIRKLRRLNEK